jgi:hypothetical protein
MRAWPTTPEALQDASIAATKLQALLVPAESLATTQP